MAEKTILEPKLPVAQTMEALAQQLIAKYSMEKDAHMPFSSPVTAPAMAEAI